MSANQIIVVTLAATLAAMRWVGRWVDRRIDRSIVEARRVIAAEQAIAAAELHLSATWAAHQSGHALHLSHGVRSHPSCAVCDFARHANTENTKRNK